MIAWLFVPLVIISGVLALILGFFLIDTADKKSNRTFLSDDWLIWHRRQKNTLWGIGAALTVFTLSFLLPPLPDSASTQLSKCRIETSKLETQVLELGKTPVTEEEWI